MNIIKKPKIQNHTTQLIIYWTIISTPIGYMLIACLNNYLCYADFVEQNNTIYSLIRLQYYWPTAKIIFNHKQMIHHISILKNYFLGIKNNNIDIIINGTDFQLSIWQTLTNIPRGKTTNYKNIAKLINRTNAQRAIGTVIKNNPISCIIPCHRVINKDGTIGRYRWGIQRKYFLLSLEQNNNKTNIAKMTFARDFLKKTSGENANYYSNYIKIY